MIRSDTLRLRRRLLSLVPLVLLLIAAAALEILQPDFIYESRILAGTLAIFFCAGPASIIAFLAARTFLENGSLQMLLLGLGGLFFSLIYLFGMLLIDFGIVVSVHNFGFLLSGLCFMLSGLLDGASHARRRRLLLVFTGYGLGLVGLAAWAIAAFHEAIPPLYTAERGYTTLRFAVLGLGVTMFAVSSLTYLRNYMRAGNHFDWWFCLSLAIITASMAGGMPLTVVGSAMAWLVRIGLSIGGIYMIVAAYEAIQDAKVLRIPLERALRAYKEQYYFLFEHVSDGILMTDGDGTILLVNKAMKVLVGWSSTPDGNIADYLEGIMVRDQSGHDLPIEQWPVNRALRGESLSDLELQISHTGSTSFYTALINAQPFHDETRRIDRVILTVRDISVRIRAEEEIRASEERHRLAVAAADLGTWDLDLLSDAAIRSLRHDKIWGYSELQPTWGHEIAMSHVLPEDRLLVEQAHARAAETGHLAYEARVRWPDGSIHWVAPSGRIHYDAGGRPVRIVGVVADITERRQFEQTRKKLEAQLQQAQKLESIGLLAGGVAHEFNNMLNVILGYAELALDDVDPETPLARYLKEIQKAGLRSAETTRHLLAFASKQLIAPRHLDLNQSIESIMATLRRLIGEQITLIWTPGTGLWQIEADQSQIDQILVNLCVNARDAIAGDGRIVIETRNIILEAGYLQDDAKCAPGEYVLLCVSDDGCGMSEDTLARIFEPFFTTKELGKGTGLGLSTVFGAVKQNRGCLTVSSRPGTGTIFRVYLPRAASGAAPTTAAEDADPVSGDGETILVVEDEQAILTMTSMVLSRLGYRVIAAGSPAEAVELGGTAAAVIDLLLTDIIMPGMNGRELAELLRAGRPDLKCLFMSGYPAAIISQQGILVEGIQFIQKPFSTRELSVAVRQTLALHG